MCGRFMLDVDIKEILKEYKIEKIGVSDYKKGDVFPSESSPIVSYNEGRNLRLASWGFPLINNKKLVINARSESISEKSMFKDSFYNRRCIVPANLFYEWKEDNKEKIKHEIYIPERELMSLGGIFKYTLNNEGHMEPSFVIITTEANQYMKDIHGRMPLIIRDEDLDYWLDKNTSRDNIDEIIKYNKSIPLGISMIEEDNNPFQQLKLF